MTENELVQFFVTVKIVIEAEYEYHSYVLQLKYLNLKVILYNIVYCYYLLHKLNNRNRSLKSMIIIVQLHCVCMRTPKVLII